jgi:hypothetical protein
MNRIHHWICSSNRWKQSLENEVFPRVLDIADLGLLLNRLQCKIHYREFVIFVT